MGADYVKANSAIEGTERNNYDDLALIKELYPDFNEFGDVDEWIDAWGSTADTQNSFIMNVYCHMMATSLAASGVVAATAAYSLI